MIRVSGKNKISGQILNEAIVAASILTVGVVAIVGFLAKATSQGRYISEQTTAVNLAAEGVEVAKNILDANALIPGGAWNEGFTVQGYYEVDYTSRILGGTVNPGDLRPLKFDEATGLYGYTNGEDTSYHRYVQITYIGGTERIRITSRVDWKGRNNRLNNVSIATDAFNWR
ncbi:MAG: hypothetical protein PHG66_02390 [Candidatus Colwellbacteria bacterium]|nr:hypothetical protein [Candidatus Colwellbacteria bacterium]